MVSAGSEAAVSGGLRLEDVLAVLRVWAGDVGLQLESADDLFFGRRVEVVSCPVLVDGREYEVQLRFGHPRRVAPSRPGGGGVWELSVGEREAARLREAVGGPREPSVVPAPDPRLAAEARRAAGLR